MDELAELKARLQRLESAEAIRDLITTYAQGADAGNDVAVLRPLYTDDAVWESPGFGRFEGGDAIANMQQRMAAERLAWTLHYMVSPKINVAASLAEAKASWYLWQLATLVDGAGDSGTPHWIGGLYDARLRCSAGLWKFAYINLDVRMVTPYHQGWVEAPKVAL
jgi:hypothetical protein